MPAGAYHLVLDSIIIKPVDVTFELLVLNGSTETELATWQMHFDPLPGASYDAQPFEYDEDCPAIVRAKGDQLVFRYSANPATTTTDEAYIPNGDGFHTHGRIPNITLPQ